MPDPLALLRDALPEGYTVDGPIKEGGQGAVLKGTLRGEAAALKVFATDPEDERLRRELELLGELKCEYLVRLLDHEVVDLAGQRVPIVAYEFIEGEDLRASITRRDEITDAEALRTIGAHVGEAVEVLWGRRIVHRDIKPENIMRRSNGSCVLVDVGIAQFLDLSTITAAAGQPGTDGYRSPEQCGGRRRLTVHSDVFSLGVTVFEVAAKVHPWNRNQAAMGRVPPASLREARPDLSRQLISLIDRMIRQHPSERPNDPGAQFRRIGGS